ncbi:MAG: hypothetical protein ABFE07_28865 [Armatimonadia bacterium]
MSAYKNGLVFGSICKSIGSVAGTVLVVFVVLKLAGLVDWSWWWVLAPFWVPAGVALGSVAFLIGFVWLSTTKFVGGKG